MRAVFEELMMATLAAVAILTAAWVLFEAGRADMAATAIRAFEREEHYRETLLVPLVEYGELALEIVEAHDSVRARELRARMPADVLSILREAEDR